MNLQSMTGWGRATMATVTTPFGLQGGSVYQRSIKQERTGTITGAIIAGAGGMNDLHDSQAALGRLLGQDVSRPQALTRLIYDSGGGVELNADVAYKSGLEFNSLSGLTLTSVPLVFTQPDPAMVENQERSAPMGASSNASQSVMYKPAGGRGSVPGAFQQVPGTLFSSAFGYVQAAAWVTTAAGDQQLWASGNSLGTVGGSSCGGLFILEMATTPPNVQVTAIGSTSAAQQILAIEQTGAGADYVWLGGTFSGCYDYAGTGHTTWRCLVREQLSTNAMTYPISVDSYVNSLAYCPQTINSSGAYTDVLYVGGHFSVANGTSFSGLFEIDQPNATGTPLPSPVPWGTVNASGTFQPGLLPASQTTVGAIAVTANGVVYLTCSGNGAYVSVLQGTPGAAVPTSSTPGATNWQTIGAIAGATSSASDELVFGPDGALYLANPSVGTSLTPGGVAMPGVARWTGGGWTWAGGGNPQGGYTANSMAFSPDGRLHMAGQFTGIAPTYRVAGSASPPTAKPGYVVWDGTTIHTELLDLICPSFGGYAAVNPSDGTVVVFADSDPVASFCVTPALVSYQGTAPAPARIVITGGSPATAMIGGVRNERTGQAIYFTGLVLSAGETITIDTTPGSSSVTSDWRGDISYYVAAMSDLANFVLLEGENYLSVLSSGQTLAAANVLWYNHHYGIDGAGANIITATYEAG